ncbi:MAG TPA: diacylglycerol kinase family protein [Acidimicrobiales bacterium]|nr:diacylglycerol kinase family protein [Acidimicrobiales bacterium]
MGDANPDRADLVERLAALAALTALVAAVVITAVAAAANWQGIVITFLGLLLIVVAGWYVVSRRGVARSLAVLAALAGAALLIAGFIVAELSLITWISVAVLAIISVVAARVALETSTKAMYERAGSRSPVPPARHPVLIMNPKSGGGKVEKFDVVQECHRRGIEPIVLERGDDLVQLAEDAIARGADVIGMAGGDGSQALVATVAVRHDVAHVVVPAGTRNHFALDLGLDRSDVVGALEAYTDGVEERIDLATVNGRTFVNNASLGLYAKIVQSPEYRDAKRQTAAAMLPEMLGPNAVPLDLRFTGPDGSSYPSAHMILVSNNPYQLASLAGRGTRARMDLGVLGVVAARIADARDAGRFVALEAAGQIRRFPGWLEWTTPRFQVDSGGLVEVGVDGEALKMDPPLVFESRPGVLRVRLPRRTVGLSPAAQAVHVMSSSTIAELGRVVVGRRGGSPDTATLLANGERHPPP